MRKKLVLIPCFFCTLLHALAFGGAPSGRDLSNRISLFGARQVASFDGADFDGFVPGEGVSLSLGEGGAIGQRPHEGSGVLVVQPAAGLKGSAWRTVRRDFAPAEDFSSTPVAQFSVFTQEAPGIEQVVFLRLYSGNEVFEASASIIPTLWRTVILDLSECGFLSKVTGLEIGLKCESDKPWDSGRDFLLDDLRVGVPLDLGFMQPSSVRPFSAGKGSSIRWKDDALELRFSRGAVLGSPDLSGSRNSIYNPPLEDRNTFFVVMENRSDIDRVLLEWTASGDSRGGKEFPIEPRSGMRAYYFNISDVPEARGALESFRLSSVGTGGKGVWRIDQIRFEREDPIVTYAGAVSSCVADPSTVRVRGSVDAAFLSEGAMVQVYEYPMKMEGAAPQSLTLLAECPAEASFALEFPNSRLGGVMTHLSSRFLAVERDASGAYTRLGKPFYIENWRDFTENPYSFTLPQREFSVLDFGAKGDGFTDDTKAIQRAIDYCSGVGGGRVVLPGSDGRYGRRYVATHISLRSFVDFHFEKGAVLWQSYDLRDYDYTPSFGHDFDIPLCPWTHCLFINYPLIEGYFLERAKITGPGTIRMSDTYSVNPDWDHYARTCSDRIHICPVGIHDSQDIEYTDVEEIRCNNYHTNFPNVENIFIGNVKLHEVQCVSGDGFSFGQGARHIRVERVFFDSNDDGIVISNSYADPRGRVSTWRKDTDWTDHSIRDLKVEHSYINSSTKGAGKAIAFIPWGTTNPDQTKQEIDGVEVYDCVLEGGHSVGTWCDNPHDGKPFDNNEKDDYSPVKNVRILGNEYRSACDLLWVKPTNFITDCGIVSSSAFVNGDFAHGHCYWTLHGNADAKDGYGFAGDGGAIYEGLYLPAGEYVFSAKVQGKGVLFVRASGSGKTLEYSPGETLATGEFDAPSGEDWRSVEVCFTVGSAGNYLLGLESATFAKIKDCGLND